MLLKALLTKWQLTTRTTITLVELAFLGFCIFAPETSEAHILVYKRSTQQLIEEYNDLPAQFGPSLPPNGLKVFAIPAIPSQACKNISPPNRTLYPPNAKFVAIIERGGINCSFELKVRNAQAVRFDAVIVYNNDGDDLETMSASNSTGIRIPSVFVGHTTGISLRSFYTDEIVILINDELPFNINTQLILPFSILIGLCFLIMIFYMIYKCIREERRLRRHRLPKSMLKKLPILKYTKNSEIANETCVICIEDFVEGDKVRVLPCKHSYHTHCIDPWLTENRRVCPICKRKVFTKIGARSNRNRQASLDSVTDTDDDTTPLLQPAAATANANNNNSNSRRQARVVRNSTTTAAATPSGTTTTTANAPRRSNRAATNTTTTSANTTRHGTFRRAASETGAALTSGVSVDETTTTDDENLLLTQQSTLQSSRRVNPFDRSPNLPPHLAEQLSNEPQRSMWSALNVLRFFRRQQPLSVAAPPYLEEGIAGTQQLAAGIRNDVPTVSAAAAAPMPMPTSNNLLNPNLSGSFKNDGNDDDDDEMIPHQTIYDPIATTVTTTSSATDTAHVEAAAADNNSRRPHVEYFA